MSSDLSESRSSAATSTGDRSAYSMVEHHVSAAAELEHVAAPIDINAAAQALRHGPRGAFFVAGVSVSLLFVGWILFYFVLFIPRGPIG